MAKFKKAAAAFALAAVAAISLMFVGCSGGGAESLGVYHYTAVSPKVIEQGWLIYATSESMTVYSDNTFEASSVMDVLYSSDGTTYNPTWFKFGNFYGTYEVTYEDEALNETTIKLTDVSSVVVANGEVTKENFSAEQTDWINTNVIGKEFILTADYEIAGGMNFVGSGLSDVFGE